MNDQFLKRKSIRLSEYDYSQNGAYFVTICTKDRRRLFGAVGADMESAPTISTVIQAFKRYSTVEYTKLVKQGLALPYNKQVWQRSFHDHVIRDQSDYDDIYRYVENNPDQWELDELYTP